MREFVFKMCHLYANLVAMRPQNHRNFIINLLSWLDRVFFCLLVEMKCVAAQRHSNVVDSTHGVKSVLEAII